MIYLLLLIGLTETQAVFAPENSQALKDAVGSCTPDPGGTFCTGGCLGETPDGSCPTFAASNDATGNPYGVIGEWDVSRVTDMITLFRDSPFNADLSKWNTGAVTDMTYIYDGSQFNGDISKWNTGAVTNMNGMFHNSLFNSDISKWDTSAVTHMALSFYNSRFNGDLSKWNTGAVTNMNRMFESSSFKRTLCGGAWESLSSNSYLTSTGRIECCPAGSYMSKPMLDPFLEANSCSQCPAGTILTALPNDETLCGLPCSFADEFSECTASQWQQIKVFYSESCPT